MSDPIRQLAEEIFRELAEEGDWCEEDWLRDEHIGRWEVNLRSTLPALTQLLGELAVAREVVRAYIPRGAGCWPTCPPCEERPEHMPRECRARAFLASDYSRLAGDLIRAVGELASRVPREPSETPRAARGKLLETAVEVDHVVSRYDNLLAAFPGLRGEAEK